MRFPGMEWVMGSLFQKGLFTVALTALFAVSGWASPLSSRLLPLVPPGADVVAGFENHGAPHFHARLLLTPRSDRLDLEDFQSLTGVDSHRRFDEVIEVAATPPGGSLSEHMVLVAGRFDREQIFSSMELNGAQTSEYEGERVLVVKPLSRERSEELATRWMVVLDNHTGIFGTPWLVQKALHRYAQHAVPDSILEERLSLLRPDVNSWNVLAASPDRRANIGFGQPFSAWAQLQQGADVFMVAARFGSKIRVDFSVHADPGLGQAFFADKAGLFADALVAAPASDVSSPEKAHRRLRNFSLESNRVQGSVELSKNEFEAWCERIFLARAGITPALASGD